MWFYRQSPAAAARRLALVRATGTVARLAVVGAVAIMPLVGIRVEPIPGIGLLRRDRMIGVGIADILNATRLAIHHHRIAAMPIRRGLAPSIPRMTLIGPRKP